VKKNKETIRNVASYIQDGVSSEPFEDWTKIKSILINNGFELINDENPNNKSNDLKESIKQKREDAGIVVNDSNDAMQGIIE
jgi:hypothetical protein